MSARAPADRSLGDLFRELSQQAGTLIRQEMDLARTEVSERASAMVGDVVWIGAGMLLVHLSLGTAVAALVLALGQTGVPLAAAAAIVATVLAVVAVIMVRSRVSAMRRRRSIPSKALDSIKETGQWLRDQTS